MLVRSPSSWVGRADEDASLNSVVVVERRETTTLDRLRLPSDIFWMIEVLISLGRLSRSLLPFCRWH